MRTRLSTTLIAPLAVLSLLGCYSAGGSGISGQASLAPAITSQPLSQAVALGTSVTFTVAGSGTPLPSYQWQRSNDGGTTWAALAGATGRSYALDRTAVSDNQAQFKVLLTDPAGSVASTPATLTVTATVGASQQVAALAPDSVPTGICVGPDGNMWFTNSGKGQIGKLDTLTHQVSLVNLPNSACTPMGITTGPDGNLWFTEQAAGALGAVSTAGVLQHEYLVGDGPTGIVAGADGNLWATLKVGNQIARMTPAGAATVYALPTAGASPSGITLAADGTVWFTESSVAKLGQISPAGGVVEFLAPMPSGGVTPVPVGITTTADGAVWYSDTANNCITKFRVGTSAPAASVRSAKASLGHLAAADVTPSGITFYPLDPGSNPATLLTDAGGNVWGTEPGNSQVVEITASTAGGTIPTSYALPASTGVPVGLALGPDGNVYVTGTDAVSQVVGVVPTDTVEVIILVPSPSTASSGTQTLQAVVTGAANSSVTWSVQAPAGGGSGGTITPDTGIYVAPKVAGTYTILAASNTTPPVVGSATVTVYVPSIAPISPANPTVQPGTSVLFSSQVAGPNDKTIRWSASDGTMDAVTGVWTVPNKAETVTITATSNADASLAATTLAIIPPSGTALPIITTAPANVTVATGATATFTVAVSGVTSSAYQWQVSANGGTTWTNVAGATSATYTTAATTPGKDGSLYQVVIYNGAGGSVTSNAARLTVTYAPVIVTQPTSVGVLLGGKAAFTVVASAEPAPTFQWQMSHDGGTTWASVSTGTGGTSTAYTTAATTAGDDNGQYQVVVTNGIGTAATSAAATLTLTTTPLGIITSPVNQTVTAGAAATFTVSAYGTPTPTYQWQVSTNGGASWTNVTTGSGGTTASYTTGGIGAVDDGSLFQVVVANGGSSTITSSTAKLIVNYVPTIQTQPAARTVNLGAPASFTVSAAGDPAPTYQWQVSLDGGSTWTNVSSGSGGTTASYTTGATGAGDNGSLFQVVIGNGVGAGVTSAPAALTVILPSIVINTYPANKLVTAGATASFTVAATAVPAPTYQWQLSQTGGSSWSNVSTGSGGTSATYTTAATSMGDNGNLYQVIITSGANSVTSPVASLKVVVAPSSTIAAPANVSAGATGLVASVAFESGATFIWTVVGGTRTDAGGTSANSITFTAGASGTVLLSCTVTNPAGTVSGPGTFNCTIAALPVNNPVITAPADVTTLATGNAASVPVQPAGSTYTWAVGNGSRTDGGGTATNSITFTAGATGSVSLSCIVTNAAGLSGTAGSGTSLIVLGPTTPTVNAPAYVTASAAGNVASVPTQPAGSTYTWVVSGGSRTDGGGNTTNSITFTAGGSGTVTVTCAITNGAGLLGSAGTASSTVVAAPPGTVTVGAPSDVTASQGSYAASITGQAGCTYAWSVSNGSIQGPTTNTSITFTAGTAGTMTISCVVSNGASVPATATGQATPHVWAAPTATLTATPLLLGPAGGTVTLSGSFSGGSSEIGNGGPGSYNLGSQGGPSGTWSLTPTQNGAGTLTYAVSTTNAAGTVASATAQVTVVSATPQITLTGPGVRVATGQNATFSATVNCYPGVNISWSVTVDGTNWYNVNSSLTNLVWDGAPFHITGYLPGIAGGKITVAGTASIDLSQPVGANLFAVTTTLTLGNLPATTQLAVAVNADSTSSNLGVQVLSPYSGNSLAAGANHTLLLQPGQNPTTSPTAAPTNSYNYIWAAGKNDLGQLGINTQTDSSSFQYVQRMFSNPYLAELWNITQVDAVGNHSLALDSTGHVWWWGADSTGNVGTYPALYANMVNGLPINGNLPVPTIMLADNSNTSFDLQTYAPGNIWQWPAGGNPTQAANFTGSYLAIAASDADTGGVPFLAAVDGSGRILEDRLYGVGEHLLYTANPAMVAVFARGDSTLAGLDLNGQVWTWTVAYPTSSSTGPTQIPFTHAPFAQSVVTIPVQCVALAKGPGFLLALDSNGGLWVWGTANSNGQLGVTPEVQTSTGGYFVPVGLSGPPTITAIAAGKSFGLALDTDGNLWNWGFNGAGELTNLATAIQSPYYLYYTNAPSFTYFPWTNVSYPGPGWNLPVGSCSDVIFEFDSNQDQNEYYIWGSDPVLYMNSLPAPSPVPIQLVDGNNNWPQNGKVYTSPLSRHALIVDGASALWAWGLNTSGQCGLGYTTPVAFPDYQQVLFGESTPPILKAATGATHSLALDANGVLWAWGSNDSGQLGQYGGEVVGTAASSVPETTYANNLTAGEGWVACAAGRDFSVGLTNHSVWAWGANQHGQIGSNANSGTPDANLYPPTKMSFYQGVFSNAAIFQVAAGSEHVLALDNNGAVWSWGGNQSGQLGNGSTLDTSIPSRVLGPGSDYGSQYPMIQICAGPDFSLALDAGGNIWGWGNGSTGVLNGTNGVATLPVQIAPTEGFNPNGNLAWITATANSVVAMDVWGDIYTWGWNPSGMLGTQLYSNTYNFISAPGPHVLSGAAPTNWDNWFLID